MERARLYLVPTGAGANEPGLRAGPDAILAALSDGRQASRLKVERVAPPIEQEFTTDDHDEYARKHHLIEARALADELAPRLAASLSAGERPIVIGGDHTVAIGAFSGVRQALGADRRVGIIWVDAHPDLNTPETTPSNHGHGMPLSALLGLGHPVLVNAGGLRGPKLGPDEVALVGIRSIDPGEADLIARHPEMVVVLPAAIRSEGLRVALEPLLRWARGLEAVHLSFDLDAIDPTEAPGVTTPVPGGLTAQEAVELVALVVQTGRLVSGDVVEHLPVRDSDGRTARLAAEIVRGLAA